MKTREKTKVSKARSVATPSTVEVIEAPKSCCGSKRKCAPAGGSCMVYCLGVIGAAIYFIGNAVGFWMCVLAFLKALIWPVFLVKGLLTFLGI